jgi:LPS-assembly protein
MALTASANPSAAGRFILIVIILALFHSTFIVCCYAGEKTDIISESLEYDRETSTYTATGQVRLKREDAILEADKVIYNERTSDAAAAGNVKYTDPDVFITGSKAEFNIDGKTGKIYDTEVFFRKDNYHIRGKVLEKKGENYYASPEATFTTCDGPVPDWSFRGKNIDAISGERLKARDVSFRIKCLPVLYTPYFHAPILTERKTGLLMPEVGYSNAKGLHINIPFFWAASENRDFTFELDHYSKRGYGEGIEFRYLEPGDISGKWWLYHLRDRKPGKDYIEIKGAHNQISSEKTGGFLSVNYINEKDFYREFTTHIESRTNRFLESTGEITVPFSNSRAYLLSQYWIDLKENVPDPAQRLPEAGYTLNPVKFGRVWLSASAALVNFWSDEGINGQRFDIFPKILHSFGKDIVISQAAGFRETAYSLNRTDDDSLHRESFEYYIAAHTRVIRKYSSFTHIAEPTLSYNLIRNTENDLPVFDSTEFYKKASVVELALLNRFMNRNGEFMVIRASQGFDADRGDRPFLPFRLDLAVKKPLKLRMNADYNVHTGRVESVNSDIDFRIYDVTVSAGQRYKRPGNIKNFVGGLQVHPFKPLYLESRIWYDAYEKKTQELAFVLKYLSQCWGISVEYIKNPDDYHVRVMFELKGLGFRKIKV